MRTWLTVLTTAGYAATVGLVCVYAWAAAYGLAAEHGDRFRSSPGVRPRL